jgi:broad specificity phosphatase PhoE
MPNKLPTITAIRHVLSAYNALDRAKIPGYAAFAKQFDAEYEKLNSQSILDGSFPSQKLLQMAIKLSKPLAPKASDYDTDIAPGAITQAIQTGIRLKTQEIIELPDAIYVSPYKRTLRTLDGLQKGWPELKSVPTFKDDRIREQEWGKEAALGDWRLHAIANPQQALWHKNSTKYEYRRDGGESFVDVRTRLREFIEMLIHEYETTNNETPKNIMLITHHLAITALKANIENWGRVKSLYEGYNNQPPNCSVTTFGDNEGVLKMILENEVFYDQKKAPSLADESPQSIKELFQKFHNIAKQFLRR